jgi:LAS superfamily LD-carboxypeptidase LdcB
MDGIKLVKPQNSDSQTSQESGRVGSLDGVRYNLPQLVGEVPPNKATHTIEPQIKSLADEVFSAPLGKTPDRGNHKETTSIQNIFTRFSHFFVKLQKFFNLRAFSLFFLAPASVLFFFIGFFSVYSQTNARYNNAVLTCKLEVDMAQNLGLDTKNLQCPEIKLQITDYFNAFSYPQTAINAETVNIQKSSFEAQIQDINSQLDNILSQLSLLEVDYRNQIETAEPSSRLDIKLDNKKIELESAQKILTTSVSKIEDLANSYAGLITLLYPADQKEAQSFLDNYRKLNQQEKIQKFGDLKSQISNAQKKISENPPLKTNTEFQTNTQELAEYKIFSGIDFQNLYESVAYQKVSAAVNNPIIIGDTAADKYIITMAEKRGYKKRPQAVETSLVSYSGQRLHVEMQESLQLMQQEAAKSGIKIGLVSGYRSVANQQGIFKSRFEEASKKENGGVYTSQDILTGKADKVIDLVLQTISIPGYSRHHNGYTVDLTDTTSKNSFTLFKDTTAYRWVSANNFLNAKKFGIIPSYPAGQTQVGPNPEEWEFVWVGVDKLKI